MSATEPIPATSESQPERRLGKNGRPAPPVPPSTLTPEIQQKICAGLAQNLPIATAAALAGVVAATVYDWLRKGANGVEGFVEFHAEAQKAIAVGETVLVKKMNDASAAGDTRATTFLLERRHREHWGRVDKVEHVGDENKPVVIQLSWPGQTLDGAPSTTAVPVRPLGPDASSHVSGEGQGQPPMIEDAEVIGD